MNTSQHIADELDRVGYDPMTETYHNRHTVEADFPLHVAIVETVSAIVGREPTAMSSLYSVLDPDALETLMSSAEGSDVQLSFAYEGCIVTVDSDGGIVVETEG